MSETGVIVAVEVAPPKDITPQTISRAALACKDLFRDIIDACELSDHVISRVNHFVKRSTTPHSSPLTHDDLSDEFEQFRVWARNLGVLASDQASLDYRLREAQDISDGIVGLLKSLRADLSGVNYILYQDRDIANTQDDDSSETTESDSDDFDLQDSPGRSAYEFQARLGSIASTINKLMQLAEIIRGSNPGARMTKAISYIHWENGVNMTEQFEQKYLPLLLEQRYKVKPTLVDRLIKAISLRRRKFQYQTKHQQRLAYPGEHESTSSRQPFPSNNRRVIPPRTQSDPQKSTTAAHLSIAPSGSNALTIATTYKKLQIKNTAPSTIVSASTRTTAENIDFPPPPRLPARATHFQCPYCCIMLSERKFLAGKGTFSKNLWSRHVVADLQPYVCLEDECQSPHLLLETQEDWVNHQKWEHAMEWWCEGDDVGHDPMKFLSSDQYIEHAQQVHYEGYESATKEAITAGRPSLLPFSACPFCDFDPASSKVSGNKSHDGDLSRSLNAQTVLQKHIVDEMTQLFLIALPERDDIEDIETDTQRQAAKGSTIRALDSVSLSFSDFDLSQDRDIDATGPDDDRFPFVFALSTDPYGDRSEAYHVDSWEDVWRSPQLQECVRSTYLGVEHDENLQEMLALASKELHEDEVQLSIPSLVIGDEVIVEGWRLPTGVKSYYDVDLSRDVTEGFESFVTPAHDDAANYLVKDETTSQYTKDGKTDYAAFFAPPEIRVSHTDDDNFID